MAANQGTSAATQEFIVRVTKDTKKRHSIMKFNPSNNVDFTKCGTARLERENNHKEFKQAYDIDAMPKFGAGSEFGREAREEARKKKFGIKIRKYVPDDQPWIMKLGSDKNVRKLKGIKEGGILENASYYIFTQCSDGAFEAFPVEEWHNFTPQVKYKVLNSEEVEEEYLRRDKTLNYFSIMLKKRLKNEVEAEDEDDDGKKVKKTKKKKDFMLTDLDEWAMLSEGEESDDDGSDNEGSGEKTKKKAKKVDKKKPSKKSRKKSNKNSEDEAMEDSDDLDEGKEVDYMTSSDSDDDNMYADAAKVKSEKYEEKGVVEEDGLRKLINSDEEDEEEKKVGEEEKKEEEEEEMGKEGKAKKEGSDSDSSSSSDSESDVEKDAVFAKALFMQQSKEKSKKGRQSNDSTPVHSRSSTPTVEGGEKGKKRKGADPDVSGAKKPRVSTPTIVTPSYASGSGTSSNSDGINDDSVRRYLLRKPMTTKELLIKFRNTGLSKDQLVTSLAQILKRLNPDKKQIKDKLYLSIKKPE